MEPILQEEDTEFLRPLTLEADILGFPPSKFVRWATWRNGYLPAELTEVESTYNSAKDMLENSQILAAIFKKCLDEYKEVSDLPILTSSPGHIYLMKPLNIELFKQNVSTNLNDINYAQELTTGFLPTSQVISWFLGAVLVYNVPDPVVHYTARGITQMLPGITPSQFNLTLLKGDFGDDLAESKVVREIMQQFSPIFPSMHFLVGESGVGKTKALVDIGCKKLSLYFDFENGTSEKDLIATVTNMALEYPDSSAYTLTAKTKYEIDLLIATRLVLLMIMKFKNPEITNEQILLAQLSDNYKIRLDMVDRIQKVLREIFKACDRRHSVIQTACYFLGVNRQSLLILCDEAQSLLQIGEGRFRSERGAAQSFYQKFVSTVISYGSVIIAGTSSEIIYYDSPQLFKARGEVVFKQKHVNFRHVTEPEDCRRIIERLFKVNLTDDHVTAILAKLKGAAQFIYQLPLLAGLEKYQAHKNVDKSNEEILMMMVDDLFDAMTSIDSAEINGKKRRNEGDAERRSKKRKTMTGEEKSEEKEIAEGTRKDAEN